MFNSSMFSAHAVTEEQACAQPCARPCAKPYAQPCAEPYANAKPFARPCAKLYAQPCAEPYANAKPCGPTCSQPYAEPCAPAGAQPGAAEFATSPAGKSQNESCVGVSLCVFGSQGTLKSLAPTGFFARILGVQTNSFGVKKSLSQVVIPLLP